MNDIIIRKIIGENGEEIIELDLNKPWPKARKESYSTYMDELEKIYSVEKRPRRSSHEFIKIIN